MVEEKNVYERMRFECYSIGNGLMEFDGSDSRSVQEGLHLGSDKKPGLGLGVECVSPKPRVKKMEWEEKKSACKKRSKPIRAGFDSDDDEPIGSLFKLKSKRNPKKVKDEVAEKGKDIEVWAEKLVVVNEDLGGMDCTLASFRKKLKGPKKDSGSGITAGRSFGIDVTEPSGQSLNGPVTVGGLAMETKVVEKGHIGEDGYDGSIDKKSENRDKEKVKRSKSALKQKKTGGHTGSHVDLDSQGLGVCSVHNQKESILGHGKGSNSYLDDNLEDSLSAFFPKAQSGSVGKSGGYLRSTQRRATEVIQKKIGMRQTSDENMQENPLSSEALQELSSTPVIADANTIYDNMHGGYPEAILKDSVPNSLLQRPQSCLSACSSKIIRTKEGEVHRQTGGIQEGPPLDLYGSDHLHDGDSEVLCSINMKDDLSQEPTSKVGFNNAVDQQPKGLCTIHLSSRDQKICCSSGKGQEACFDDESYNRLCEDTSQETLRQLIDINLEVSAKSPFQYSSPCNEKMDEKSLETGDYSNHLSPELCLNESVTSIQMCCSSGHENQPSDDVPKGTCIPNHQCLSSSGEANGASSPSITPDRNESYAEDKRNLTGPESEDKKRSAVQRAVRKANKRRHGDMAYEGDADWEILNHEQGFLESHLVEDGDQSSRAREKLYSSSNTVMEAENGGAAAVSAGLKVHAAGPVEKIKFKELLKRKGGLQEYLQCRNHILGLWSKDVTRILPLTECGVSNSPPVDEPPHASLVREIYAFLDQSGYINVGVATEKDRAEPGAMHNFRLLKERKFGEKAGAPDADTDDGVSFILGQVRSSEVPMGVKNGDILDDQNQAAGATIDGKFVTLQAMDLSTTTETDECRARELDKNGSIDAKSPSRMFNVDVLGSNPSCKVVDSGAAPVINPELTKQLCGVQFASNDVIGENHSMQCHLEVRKRIIVIGAGPAGLTAARHLQRQGFSVTVLEARSRIGGRVYTDRSSLSVPVDLGASIITGVEADVATERRPDPSSLICAQLGLELTVLNSDCPLYDIVTGQKVPADLDEALEAEYNSLLDDMVLLVAQKGERAMKMSLEDGLENALKRRRMARLGRNYMQNELHISTDALVDSEKTSVDCKVSENNSCKEEILSPLERRVMDWHFANLEYGCATLLKKVSLPYWNQDDVYGGFGGAHCMIKGGYSTVVESLGGGLCIHLNHVVKDISYCAKDCRENDDQHNKVKVSTSNGREFSGEAVLITVPLGCLKAEAIKFSPPLPKSKHLSIQRLGFGVLNKVVLEFPEVFWDDSVDYFGATAEETNQRGQCFMFWNVKKTVGAPVLIALVVGKAAIVGENMSSSDHVNHALTVLRKLFGEAAVPDPVASVVTDWGKDPFSYGAYSYVAVGASGEDYDILGRPVENCLFFAGEATCKEHPDTVGGAMMSGLREAVRIGDILNTGNDYTAEVEAMEAAQRHSDSERSEVRDIVKRLEAVELSNLLYKDSLDGPQFFPREALLQDIFSNAKTTAARLHLAKELLNLPVEALKSFAGTKEGLRTLNSWILDSMGKDGTQLLRHCVRLLVLVSTDLLAVRLSGIGKTVKEKVCVHTSRDIRAIASQLVNVWIEVFRKEKASNGGLKLLRHSTAADSLKSKSLASGKPPLRTHHGPPDNKGSSQIFASAGSHLPPSANVKRVNVRPVKLETRTDSKLEVKLTRSQGSIGREDAKGEEDHNFVMSEEEQVAFAAAETARAAALAAAEAYASSEAKCNTSLPLPKILSFHKFARREQHTQMDVPDIRRKWSGGALGRQDCISEIDSRNCRVRDWSVDFSAACVNLDSTKMSLDNLSQQSHSNEIACQLNFREHSGESAAEDSNIFTKAWVDAAGSVGIKDYNAIDRWQSQAAAANSDFFHRTMKVRDEEDSNMYSKLPTWRHEQLANESSVSQVTVNKELVGNQPREAEHIKQAVVDYVASLLMPIYKAKKIEKEGYKSIMKKTATKVMEQTTDPEKTMPVYEFLDFKRKNKIRSFVDKLIERHMTMKPVVKS